MTEFDQVKAMFERAGIAFEIVEDNGAHQIIWEGQTGPNNRGDYGEEAELDFSTDGSLLYAGAWAKLLARARRQWRTDRS